MKLFQLPAGVLCLGFYRSLKVEAAPNKPSMIKKLFGAAKRSLARDKLIALIPIFPIFL